MSDPVSSRPLHVAVIGCGYWGSKHVRVLSGNADVELSLVDRDAGRRGALAEAYPIRESVGDLNEILGDLDAAVIATPPLGHYPLAKACLEAGVHVLVEKPLTTTVAHANHLIDMARERGLTLMVGHTFEFNAAVWALAEAVKKPEFGAVRYINSARLNLGLYQPDVDVLWDLAPHDISIINRILESRPTSVSAWGLELMADKPDVAYLNLKYDDIGVGACIHVSWLDPMKVRRTTVVGEHQMAVYDDMAEERLRVYDKGVDAAQSPVDAAQASADPSQIPMSYRHGNIVSPFIDFNEPLALELGHFVDSINNGTKPMVDGVSGREVVSVLCAAQDSLAQGGGWVDVDYDASIIDLRDRLPSAEEETDIDTIPEQPAAGA